MNSVKFRFFNGYELLMAAVIIARSTSFVISKISIRSFEPLNLLAVRFTLAFLVLVLIFFKKFKNLSLRIVVNGFILGATYTAVMFFEMAGLATTETAVASFIENSAFILVPFLEIAFLHIFPSPKVLVGIVLTFIGVALLTLAGGASVSKGSLYCLVAMAFYALAIFETSLFARMGEPLLVGIIQVATMAFLSIVASVLFESTRLPSNQSEWIMIALLALVCTVFGFTLQPVAQKEMDVDRAGMFSALNPLAATFWGYIILDEKITWIKSVGAVLIILGIVFPSLKRSRRNSGLGI